ncbi:phosphoglycerate kinase [bacterium]|nr:MAG: phosphoglycerate kinase [bacterium]
MSIKSIDEIALLAKKVFVRVDFNVPMKNGEISDDTRIRAALPTFDKILSSGGAIIAASHLGRPKNGPDPTFGLAPVAKRLGELVKAKVILSPEVVGETTSKLAAALKPGEILLLENVRFDAGETKNNPDLSKAFASLADAYVNDAFGACHRAHSSTAGIAEHFSSGEKAAGYLMLKEVNSFDRVLKNPARPFVAILGGAKVSDKIAVIENLLSKVDKLIIGGAMAFTFLKAQGFSIGDSLVEDDKIDLARSLVATAKARGVELLLPIDHLIAADLADDLKPEATKDANVPAGMKGLDIGPATVELYKKALAGAATVVWNGPMGVFENPALSGGTFAVAEEVASCGGYTVVGGGDSVSAVKKSGKAASISHVSTGGGASLELLEGKILPGMAALEG